MVAEAVTLPSFQDAFEALDPDKGIEVEFAIYAIEEDPGWADYRVLAPATSPWSGFMVDLNVDGYAIVYKVADHGAVVELTYLHEMPGWQTDRPKHRGPVQPM